MKRLSLCLLLGACAMAGRAADTLATSYTLAKAAERIGGYDLLLFGRHAVDGDTAQTGPAVAAQLDIPQITLAETIEVEDGWVRCERALGAVRQRVRAKLPALVTVTGRQAMTHPIAGSRPRGATVDEDVALGQDLAERIIV